MEDDVNIFTDKISKREARNFCCKWHYSNIFPPHCLAYLAYHDDKGLAGVSLWGWGVRPVHTIKKLFHSLDTKDYMELNRLCLRDDCPKNSESWFLSQCIEWFKKNQPQIKILITWADGIRGKCGYIYQASNWLYGGFITTEIYTTKDGEPIHPRLMITRYGTRTKKFCDSLGLKKIHGRQFIYCYFLCSHKERKTLLRESSLAWTSKYPKQKDLLWKIDAGEVSRETRDVPNVKRAGQFRHPAFNLELGLFP